MIAEEGINLVDVAVRVHGTVEALFDLAQLNGLPVTAELETGQELLVHTGRQYPSPPPARPQVRAKPKPAASVVVSDGQNLVDIALQELGGVEGLLALAIGNGMGPTDSLQAGQVLALSPEMAVNRLLVNWYRVRGIRVNSGQLVLPVDLPPQAEMVDFHHLDFIETDFY